MAEWNKETETKIIAKAWKDEGYRKKLLSNPKGALKEYGIEIPKSVELKVYTEDANHLYFVVPMAPAEMSKLSNEELEKLAAAASCALNTNNTRDWNCN